MHNHNAPALGWCTVISYLSTSLFDLKTLISFQLYTAYLVLRKRPQPLSSRPPNIFVYISPLCPIHGSQSLPDSPLALVHGRIVALVVVQV